MMISPSKFSTFIVLAALTLCFGGAGGAVAESMPDTENGRYALSPVTDGVIRLDTRTGAVSTCSNNGNGWACYTVPDERAALDAEIGRLQMEIQAALVAPALQLDHPEALPRRMALQKRQAAGLREQIDQRHRFVVHFRVAGACYFPEQFVPDIGPGRLQRKIIIDLT